MGVSSSVASSTAAADTLEHPRAGAAALARGLFAACALATCAFACGANAARDVSTGASERALERRELTDFVPAAGMRWLVVGSPRQLAREPGLASLRTRWLTEDRRRAFALETGVDLFATERALAAGFDLGTLYLADASGFRARPEVAFARRLAGSERLRQPRPDVWHVTGLVGSEPEALVRVADVLVAVAVGDVTLARVVELRALGRLERAAPAFRGASLSTLPAELLRPAAFAFYAAELRSVWHAFAASSLGRGLALDRPLEPTEVRGSERLLEIDSALDAAAFSAGLEALLVGNLDDLVAAP